MNVSKLHAFLPLVKSVAQSMGCVRKEPITLGDKHAENILQIVYGAMLEKDRKEAEIFYPLLQNALYSVFEHKTIVVKIHAEIEKYLME